LIFSMLSEKLMGMMFVLVCYVSCA